MDFMRLFIINTNQQADKRYEQEMLKEQKCAAYRSTKDDIERIQKGDYVLLYSNGSGIIARGIADGRVRKQVDLGIEDDEYYMGLIEFYEYIKEIPYKKIKEILQKADSSFGKPFNKTALKFESPYSEKIWKEVCRYV